MAPRRRPKRDKKMDAAVETMEKEYGISDVELIKKVANELLDEYGGGDSAWYFIEQYTYLELLEAIVRYREANPQENNGQANSAGGESAEGGTAESNAPKDAAGPSSVAAEPICSEVVDSELEKDTKDDINRLPSAERNRKSWRDVGLCPSSCQREIRDIACDTQENSGSNEDAGSMLSLAQLIPTTPLTSSVPSHNSPLLSPSSAIHSPATANTGAASRRRLPCYGWIESDEEDIDDFIQLHSATQVTAAGTPESGESRSCGMDSKLKRRSRWDLRPEDP